MLYDPSDYAVGPERMRAAWVLCAILGAFGPALLTRGPVTDIPFAQHVPEHGHRLGPYCG
jgi:hypothetical protein